nr:PREDICTED: uncharacterized protein LOC105662182 [Megachile rotundata]
MVVSYSVHAWIRALHSEQLTTLSIAIADMKLLENFYYNVSRPMVIIFFFELSALRKFSHNSKFLKMSAFAWLVIFQTMIIKSSNDYCHNPRGNIFHLAFDTEMLVVCKGDNALYEWYSIDGNTTETFRLANWTTNKEDPTLSTMHLLTNLSLYDRRNDLKGTVLKGVLVKNSLLYKPSQNKTEGYFSTMIVELQNSLNFTIEIVAKLSEFGSYNTTTERWGGAMHYVATGIVDIGVADFSMTNNRLNYVDYLVPIITIRTCMYFKQPDALGVKWFAYFKAFNFNIWKSLFVVFMISVFTVAFIKSQVHLKNFMGLVCDEFLLILGVICQQGLIEFPRHSSLRVAYSTILLSAIVIMSAYSASLICFLTARVRYTPFRTITEFLDDETYRIIVLKGSAEYDTFFLSKDPIATRIKNIILPIDDLPIDIESGFKRVCFYASSNIISNKNYFTCSQICEDPKLAFYTNYSPQLEKFATIVQIPCQVTCLAFGRVNSLSLILPKGSQYTMALNFHLHKLINSGILNRYKPGMSYEEQNNFEPVEFGSIASVLLILGGGVVLAFLVLLVEVYYNKRKAINNFVSRTR